MGDPDLYSDETIRLTAENIIVKSTPFEAILTNKRIILVDSRKKHIPQQTILLATLRHAEMSENAIRDPIITLSILTNTGSTRQMVLTFSKKSGGERKRECEEWIKILRDYAASSTQTVSHMVAPSPGQVPQPEPDVTTPPQIRMTSGSAVKKKIEIARPIKKIIETGPVPPKPIEISTLPEGAFCSRCGNRVPVGSAFCNRCGSKVIIQGEQSAVPAPVVQTVPAPPVVPATPPVTDSTAPVPALTPQVTAPETPSVTLPTPSVTPVIYERAVRPIEQIIHSIEPLIDDSVPRSEQTPLFVREFPLEFPTLPTSPTVSDTPVPATELSTVAFPETADGAVAPAAPVIPSIGETPLQAPPALPPVPEFPPAVKKRRGITIAAIVIVMLVIVAGAFVVLKPMQGAGGNTTGSITITPTVTPLSDIITTTTTSPTHSPTITAAVTSLPTTTAELVIPQTNVWLRITYPRTYTGTYGPPGQQVTDTGDHFYQISTVDGPVVASVNKQDGSGDKLTVAVYKNGVLIKEDSTTRPRGIIDFQAVLKTPTPTPVPTTIATTVVTTVTPVVNATVTVNATQTVVTE
jgi:DNA-directed RNA polymerase subunit RPC12/RpoP